MKNEYIPFLSEIKEVIKHTEIEYTFRMAFEGTVKPGQFFEVSIPKYGEAPISVSGMSEGTVDLTIRKVGKVTGEIFEKYVGDKLFLRGPYGNGFDLDVYRNHEIVVVAGGTGLSPVRGIVEHFAKSSEACKGLTLITGFKTPEDVLFKADLEEWSHTAHITVTVDQAPEGYEGPVGLVTKYIPELPIQDLEHVQVIVVGPPIMMKFTVQAFLKRGIKEENIWISQERKMCCGIGKCGHCKMGDTYICLEGPVFNYTQGKLLRD
ncbi:MAG: anaerobic sulfite reductase subunit AsrB [Niameybacter sp.]|uniref:anaerobic sulfite reductase subunit AsrB n=1 Tax=Niameybacter sp. TaxID=2033640 RepID=UPI002FCA6E63